MLILLLVLCIDPAVSHAAINFAAATGLPAGQVREMQFFLDQTDQRQKSGPAMRLSEIEQIASFLVRWVSESRALPKGRECRRIVRRPMCCWHLVGYLMKGPQISLLAVQSWIQKPRNSG